MRGATAKKLRRQAESMGRLTRARVYRRHPAGPIVLHPLCTRSIYQRLKGQK